MKHLTRVELEHHALAWIDAWNRQDLDAVLVPFVDDAVFVSPRAESITGNATVRGRSALQNYWKKALAAVPDLRFEIETAVCDESSQVLLVHYVSRAGGRTVRACELMRFRDGRQVYGEAFYGAEIGPNL
ncbi:nuclear transport factor 2 family protein [Xanthobacter flavus]|uniref:nuclear transport factor 2 family protein n=1 Tax=Xanthobacter flavus TaxID=281 RepID=UPI001AE85B83|nr:nuclear transport factor 2 family protein [Xanthobacter flavus]MBP2150988.1 steroid delta-isomerase [Xanthobacter flavus]